MPTKHQKNYTGYAAFVEAKETWKSYPAKSDSTGNKVLVDGTWITYNEFAEKHPEPQLKNFLQDKNYKGENACTRMANIA